MRWLRTSPHSEIGERPPPEATDDEKEENPSSLPTTDHHRDLDENERLQLLGRDVGRLGCFYCCCCLQCYMQIGTMIHVLQKNLQQQFCGCRWRFPNRELEDWHWSGAFSSLASKEIFCGYKTWTTPPPYRRQKKA